MGLLQRLFNIITAKKVYEDNWEELAYSHDDVDFDDEVQRTRYISGCLEQMAEATKEIGLLQGEYNLVTSYLTDIEEIEGLPEDDRLGINHIAGKLKKLESEREKYKDRKNKLDDTTFRKIEKIESEMEEGIEKIKEAEKYEELVKADLRKLDGERNAYEYRKEELANMRTNFRGMTIIIIVALVVCELILLCLHFFMHMEIFAVAIAGAFIGALSITILYIKYSDADREALRVANSINKLILLQNKVKIRYVNNTNLLDYLYIKYGVDDSTLLKKQWESYKSEKDARKVVSEAEARADYYKKELITKLSNYHVKDPTRWVHQAGALVDPKEMVEIRHELVKRRQSLRKQLDYNQDVAKMAQNEVKLVAEQYPKYTKEIFEMVSDYEASN